MARALGRGGLERMSFRVGSGRAVIRIDDNVREAIAAAASDRPEFRAAAAKVHAAVLANAARHVDSGRLAASIKMVRKKTDYHIESDGVSYSWHTEFGHYTAAGGKRKWVQGIGIFRDTVAQFGGYS